MRPAIMTQVAISHDMMGLSRITAYWSWCVAAPRGPVGLTIVGGT
jgi:hypothetical protein